MSVADDAGGFDVSFSEDDVKKLEVDSWKVLTSVKPALLRATAFATDGINVTGSMRRAAKRTVRREEATSLARSMATDDASSKRKHAYDPHEHSDAQKLRGLAFLDPVAAEKEIAAAQRVRGVPFAEAREEAKAAAGQPGSLSMLDFARKRLLSDYDASAARNRTQRTHERWEYELPEIKANYGLEAECEGDRRVAAMQKALAYLDRVGYARSKQQKIMHTAMIVLSLKSYYGEDLEQNLVRLLRKYNISELRTEGIFLAPRRFGKSVSVAMFAACELVTQPTRIAGEIGHDVLIYSNNHRASKMLLLMTHKLVCILQANPEFGGTVIQLDRNCSMKVELGDGSGTENELFAYPANEEKLRGTGSKACTNTTIAEEFAYMPPDLLFKIIGPTLVRLGVKFIGITTVKGSDSFVTPLASAHYPDGRPIMLTLNFELVCKPCKRAGRAHLCRCKEADIPPWQRRSQHGKLKLLMGSGNLNTFMEEIKGVSIEEKSSSAFLASSVAWLRTPESIVPQRSFMADTIYTSIDPACGGKHSKFAIVSAVWHDRRMVVSSSTAVCLFALARRRRTQRAARPYSPRA